MNFKLDRSALVFVSLFTLAACRGEDPGDGSGGSSSGGGTTTTGGSSESTSPTVPTSTDPTTGPVDPSTTTTTGPDPDTGNESCAFIGNCTEPMDQTTGPAGPLPDGSQCSTDDECASMNCYSIPMFGGFCAECNEDADCVEAGTGISCSIDIFSMNAACAPGVEGNNCESDAACMDPLVCAPVIETGGFLPLDTCGECADSSMCMNGELCSPVLEGLGGSNQCVAPGSVMNNSLCPTDPADGNMACMSGFCSNVSIMGFLNVPVCGECGTDMDCPMGTTCMDGVFDANSFSFTGSTCG